jgi:hypothetical protein
MPAPPTAKRKYYTAEQANATLPLLRLIVRDIAALAHTLREQHRRLERWQNQPGSVPEEQLDQAVTEIERGQEQMRAYEEELAQLEVELKDYLVGLVDFPARMEGREVYLCWRLGEPEVAHWHELDAGFAGRQKLARTVSR